MFFVLAKAGSDQGFRKVPLLEPPSQPHPNASRDTMTHEHCGISEMAVPGSARWCPAVPCILRFDPSKKKAGAKADLPNSFLFVLGPGRKYEEVPSLCRCFKKEPPENGFIDSYRFKDYSQKAYVTYVLAVQDGMC